MSQSNITEQQEERLFNEICAEYTMKRMKGMINEVDLNKIVQNQNLMYDSLNFLISFRFSS